MAMGRVKPTERRDGFPLVIAWVWRQREALGWAGAALGGLPG